MWFQQNAFQTKHIECLWLKPFQVSYYYRLNLCSSFQIWLDGIFVCFWKKAYISTEIPCTGHNCRVSSILNIDLVSYSNGKLDSIRQHYDHIWWHRAVHYDYLPCIFDEMTISRHDLICTKTIDAQDFPAIARENNVIQLNWNIKRKVVQSIKHTDC